MLGELLGLLVPQLRGKGSCWEPLLGLPGLAGAQLGLGVAEEMGRAPGGFSGSFYSGLLSWWYRMCSVWDCIPCHRQSSLTGAEHSSGSVLTLTPFPPFPRASLSPGGAEAHKFPPWISSTAPGVKRAAGAWPRPPRATGTGGSGCGSWRWKPSTSTRWGHVLGTAQPGESHIHGSPAWLGLKEC